MSKLQPKVQYFLTLLILFFLPAYLIKIRFGWASFNLLEILIGVLFLLWIVNKAKKYSILNTQYSIPILLILIGLVFSVLVNRNYYAGFGAIKGWFIFPILFGAIFFDQLGKNESLLKKSLLVLFYSGVAVSVVGFVYKFLGIATFDGRLAIFWDSPNQLAMFLAIPLLIGISLLVMRAEPGNFGRVGFFIGGALIAFNLYFTRSYGAWLAISVAVIVLLWLEYGSVKKKKNLLIFSVIILILLGLASFKKFQNIENLGGRSSLASRIMIWKSAGLMASKNPIFGIGPGNFQNKYLEYQKYFPSYLEWSAPQPHNIFLAFWLESGLLGLAGFVILLFYFFRDNKKVYPCAKIPESESSLPNEIKKQTREGLNLSSNFGDGVIHDLRALFLVIIVYILIHGLIDTTYWRNDLAVVFWIIIFANYSLARGTTEKPQE